MRDTRLPFRCRSDKLTSDAFGRLNFTGVLVTCCLSLACRRARDLLGARNLLFRSLVISCSICVARESARHASAPRVGVERAQVARVPCTLQYDPVIKSQLASRNQL